MRSFRPLLVLILVWAAALCQAQAWSEIYSKALDAAKGENWGQARTMFKDSASRRAEDFSAPTVLSRPGQPEKVWRGGASYSPNFGAAYAGYKLALKLTDEMDRTALLKEVAAEFNTLLAKNQHSRAAYFFLGNTYNLLNDTASNETLEQKEKKMASKMTWKVDEEIMTSEDQAMVSGVAVAPTTPTKPEAKPEEKPTTKPEEKPEQKPMEPAVPPVTKPEEKPVEPTKPEEKPAEKPQEPKQPKKPVRNPTQGDKAPPKQNKPPKTTAQDGNTEVTAGGEGQSAILGDVTKLPTKFALIIGNSESQMTGMAPTFATTNAEAMRDTLTKFGGYPEENVSTVLNGSTDQMLAAAKALAEKVAEGQIVLIYFSGVGSNLDGKDYLAGTNTTNGTDVSTMLEKMALYRVFMAKGASIFAFFEVNRPIVSGRYFGQEVPSLGAIAQMQATVPGGTVGPTIANGKEVGIFANSFGLVLDEFRSNKIPVVEFAWQLFDRMKRGTSGSSGGGASQVPTLPTLTMLAPDSRF